MSIFMIIMIMIMMIIALALYFATSSDGCLGSSDDEGRSDV